MGAFFPTLRNIGTIKGGFMNPLLEGQRKMQELFDKIEFVLAENFEVINNLLVPKKKEEMSE